MTFTTAPNILTLVRILFVPVIVAFLYFKSPNWDLPAALLFVAASITDYFDGYLARRQNLETVYGKLMDPLADKFLVVCTLIMLHELKRIHPVVVMVLISREMAITGLRALASAEGVVIGASTTAKWKTATQMIAIPCIIARSALFGIPLYSLGMVLLYISLAISLWSARDYVINFFRAMREARKHKMKERKMARTARHSARTLRMAAKAAQLQKRLDQTQ